MSPFPLTVIALALALAGCITPPELDPRQRTIANEHLGLSSRMVVPIPVRAWWGTFNDPQLDHLMQLALADNPSLAQAGDRPGLFVVQSGYFLFLRLAGAVVDPTVLARAPPRGRHRSRSG